jgi:hypothetical protein
VPVARFLEHAVPKTATRKGVVAGQAPATPAAPTTPTDWEAIERAFRAGVLSVREIAKQQGVSDTAIRKKAKAGGWLRDLTAKVQERVRAELVRSEVRAAHARTTEGEVITEAAVGPVQAVKLHRVSVRRAQSLAETLMEQLEEAIGNRDAIEEAIHEDTAEADNAKPDAASMAARARRSAMLKAVSLPAHVAALRDLGTALSKFIPLERQAYSIVGNPEPPPTETDTVDVSDASLDAFTAKLDKVLARAKPEAPGA